jgi:hypothetical protein
LLLLVTFAPPNSGEEETLEAAEKICDPDKLFATLDGMY